MKKILLILLSLILLGALILIIAYYNSDEYQSYKTAVKPYQEAQKKWKQLENKEIEALIDNNNIVDSIDKKEVIEEFARNVGVQIEMLDGITFSSGMEGFVTNSSSNAKLITNQENDVLVSFIKLDTEGIKDVIISKKIKIPDNATHIRFSYRFLSTEDKGLLEGFIDKEAVVYIEPEDLKDAKYQTYADKSKKWPCTEWIQIVYPEVPAEYSYTGKTVDLSFRLTNLEPEVRSHTVFIDDIYFAKIY